jgi:transcriptional regulator with XRE-family HTH domain
MPRPPLQVPPETLGGRLRAARKKRSLSLAEVAGKRYSTSLISQIERNRIEPSEGSLRFLAERLNLSYDELLELSQQQKGTEDTTAQLRYYEDLRSKASAAFKLKHFSTALSALKELSLSDVPQELRWRIAALRGQCYFTLRAFLAAQQDFIVAAQERPEIIADEMMYEALMFHLHFASTLRELEQVEAAYKEYERAFALIDKRTPAVTIAEAYWGRSLSEFALAYKATCEHQKQQQLGLALQHAEHASLLYRTIGEPDRASLLTCQIGMIEQALGNLDGARSCLQEALEAEQAAWHASLRASGADYRGEDGQREWERRMKEQANVLSALACSLAGIELEARNYTKAQSYAEQALEAGKASYTLREAEAEMMLGRILEANNPLDHRATEMFQNAINLLGNTDRIAARIRAYNLMGRHLLKIGDIVAGETVLDQALQLSNIAATFTSSAITTETEVEMSGGANSNR